MHYLYFENKFIMMQQQIGQSTSSKVTVQQFHKQKNKLKPENINNSCQENYFQQNQISILRKYLEEGNNISIQNNKQQKSGKQELVAQNIKKSVNQINNSNKNMISSTASNTSQSIAECTNVDYAFVIECANYDMIATCEQLLVFDQCSVFQKLRQQYKTKRKNEDGDDDVSDKNQGIDDCDLLDNLNTRQLFAQYLGRRNNNKSSNKQKGQNKSVYLSQQNKQNRANKGFIHKILALFKAIGTFISLHKNRDHFLRYCAVILTCLLAVISIKYRASIILAVKILLNLN